MPLTLFCNTSFVKDISDSAPYRTFKRNLQNAKIIWFKDGVKLQNDGSYHKNKSENQHDQNLTINHFSEPTVSSTLRIHNTNSDSIGKYTCKFRSQNITTVVVDQESNDITNILVCEFFLYLFLFKICILANSRNLEMQSSSSDKLKYSVSLTSLITLTVYIVFSAWKFLY